MLRQVQRSVRNQQGKGSSDDVVMARASRQVNDGLAAFGLKQFTDKTSFFPFQKLHTGGFDFTIGPEPAETGACPDCDYVLCLSCQRGDEILFGFSMGLIIQPRTLRTSNNGPLNTEKIE